MSNTYVYDDPRLLGQTLVTAAYICFSRGERHAVYECNGKTLRFSADGNPFKVAVSEVRDEAASAPMFEVHNTGDGLTFLFASDKALSATASIIQHSAKDHSQTLRMI